MPQKTGAELRNHRANLAPHYIWFEGSAEIGFSAGRQPVTRNPAPKIRLRPKITLGTFPKVR